MIVVFCFLLSDNTASTVQEADNTMQCKRMLVRTLGVVTLVGIASLGLPCPAQAGGVHVSIGVGLPVVVAPAPVIVQPAPVVVPPPIIVQRAPGVRVPLHHARCGHHHGRCPHRAWCMGTLTPGALLATGDITTTITTGIRHIAVHGGCRA